MGSEMCIRDSKVTVYYTAPTAIRMHVKWGEEWPKKYDLSSLRILGTVGEPINEEAWLWYFKHIGGERCPIIDTWWQTETGATCVEALPGIGPFISVLIRYEVDDISRFREAKKFASYTGLVPSTYASGDRMIHGRLTKQGNKWLRWAFVEAVMPAITHSPWLRRYYERIKRRRGSRDACVATARKLAELAWTVWTEKRFYEER